MNERIREFERKCWDFQSNILNTEKFAELIIRDVLAQVEEIQRLDNVLKTKVGIDFEINVAYEILKNFGLRSGFCACCGVPAGTKCEDSCVWS